MDYTLKIGDLIMAFSALVGPVVAVWQAAKITNRDSLRSYKLSILRDLVAFKFASPTDVKAGEALNFVPVLFGDNNLILSYLSKYKEIYNNPAISLKQKDEAYTDLILEIAKALKIKTEQKYISREPFVAGSIWDGDLLRKLTVHQMTKEFKVGQIKSDIEHTNKIISEFNS